MTRTVQDAALMLGAMQGLDRRDPATAPAEPHDGRDYTTGLRTEALKGARLGVARKLFGFHPQTDALMAEALAALKDAGAELVDPIDLTVPKGLQASILRVMLADLKPASPPRRSVVMLFVGAEEQGLLGSKYYAEHSTFPTENIAANINFELGNIWGRTENVVIHGLGKTSLDAFVKAAAGGQQRRVEDEADPRSGWYYRSDQFSFARVGVPAIWFESGRDFVA